MVRRANKTSPERVIDSSGWLARARRVPSPNCDDRPAGVPIELVVVHSISLPPGEYGGPHIEALFMNRLDPAAHPYFAPLGDLRVSAHCVIDRAGELAQFVPFTARAWHAGVSNWRDRGRCNDFSIGIELEGTDTDRYTPAQYGVLAATITAIARRYPISAVVGHSDIAPGRKTDPGPGFDWDRLYRLLRQ